ncbi:MAG: hypothetical protein KDA48_17340 [Amphiplicatus sp.]|nr:hypothetical protein [Amphiplicatus sp.]
MNKEVKPTDLINRFYDEVMCCNFDYALSAADPTYFSHTEKGEVDPATLALSCKNMMAPLENAKREVLFEFNDGELGVVIHTCSATLRETGEPFKIRSADVYRVQNGKLMEHWGILQPDG